METRSFLWGLIRIDRYGYRWGYTIPQIELLAIDCPITVYPKKGEKNKPSSADIKEAKDEWIEKYGDTEKGEKIDLTALLSQYKPKE